MPADTTALDTLNIRPASEADFPLLARMNRELIEDEGHRNPMTVPQLEARFRRFVGEEGYRVDVLLLDGEIAGYATHRYEPDLAEPSGQRVFLRQFYIARGKRGGGLGRRALELLIDARFADGDRIFLDVMETNPGGKAFWSRTAFTPYATTMERVVRKP
ncbi:GNAT family N-acetyltransferase [Paraburkholderia sp.]|uniref:GNAT family N-acetyltransferase n=1 Tax=Paraburkholderia sp. TaxID=1926495 RepID=UPI0039E2A970